MTYKDPEIRKQKAREYSNRNKEKYRELKNKSVCGRCGFSNPISLQFHHRNPSDKKFTISHSLSGTYSWNTILKEIEKCDVLCANCHSIETFESHARIHKTSRKRILNTAIVRNLKENSGCEKCGIKDHRVLQFHHNDPSNKVIEISNALLLGWDMEDIYLEMDKCSILCSNCHFIEHS